MTIKLAKRLHESCGANIVGPRICSNYANHIAMAKRILGAEYMFISIKEFNELYKKRYSSLVMGAECE